MPDENDTSQQLPPASLPLEESTVPAPEVSVPTEVAAPTIEPVSAPEPAVPPLDSAPFDDVALGDDVDVPAPAPEPAPTPEEAAQLPTETPEAPQVDSISPPE